LNRFAGIFITAWTTKSPVEWAVWRYFSRSHPGRCHIFVALFRFWVNLGCRQTKKHNGVDPYPKGEFIMKEKVEAALQKVRPMLQADGGDVELVDVQDGIVTVRLQGACGGCPMSQMTLKNGIERILKQEVPEVVSVESAP
jgi:Fe-S cluster biogenesis protein NfuA